MGKMVLQIFACNILIGRMIGHLCVRVCGGVYGMCRCVGVCVCGVCVSSRPIQVYYIVQKNKLNHTVIEKMLFRRPILKIHTFHNVYQG